MYVLCKQKYLYANCHARIINLAVLHYIFYKLMVDRENL